MDNVKLSAPWITYYREIEALFKEDPEVHVEFDEDNLNVKLFVDNPVKAEALIQLLPSELQFGNVTLKITIIPANEHETSISSLYQRAFENNPIFHGIFSVGDLFSNPLHYVIFKNQVVQYYNDNLNDPHGNTSTLFQDIAKHVFNEEPNVFFCTDLPDKKG